jgi:4-hydroxy-3-polyprenylbenzoate decarboxylase
MTQTTPPLIVALTGATGMIYGVRMLEILRTAGVPSHLVMSKWAIQTLLQETAWTVDAVKGLATEVHNVEDYGAVISSGSFVTRGMAVVPCSMRTLAAISTGSGTNLIHRAADVVLKERRKLVLVPREAPLSDIHLEHMLRLSRMGTVIFPPVPAFYQRPGSIDDLVDHTVMRILDQFDLHLDAAGRWNGRMQATTARS